MIDDNWIEGRNSKGCVGIFPKNYVIELKDSIELDFCDSDLELSRYQKQTKQYKQLKVRRRFNFNTLLNPQKMSKVNSTLSSTDSPINLLPQSK